MSNFDDNDKADYRISLKEFILRIMDEREKSVEHRLNKLNELREEVTSDRSQFLKAETFEVQHRALTEKVDNNYLALTGSINKLADSTSKKIEALQKIVFIGVGIVFLLSAILQMISIYGGRL